MNDLTTTHDGNDTRDARGTGSAYLQLPVNLTEGDVAACIQVCVPGTLSASVDGRSLLLDLVDVSGTNRMFTITVREH